jgi:adenylate cyclase
LINTGLICQHDENVGGIDVAEGGGGEQATGAGCGTHDVFISYASQDAAVANAVVAALERHGLTCWIAPRDVTPGALYADEIIRSINEAKALVIVLSASAIASPHVGKEVERASSKRRPIITLKTDTAPLTTALEYFLSESQWVDIGVDGTEAAFAKLISAVRRQSMAAPTGKPGQPGGTAQPASEPLRRPPASLRLTRRLSRPLVATFAVIAVIGVYLVVDKLWLSKHAGQGKPAATAAPPATPAAPTISEKSIAVLPFVDMSEKKDQEYLADGLSEELIDHLARSPDLLVIARTSSFQFKGKNEDVRRIASTLGVAHLLEGSVRKSGTTLRISAQLIRASDGTHLWSQTYDRGLADVFKLQDEIAETVTQALKVTLTPTAVVQASEIIADAHDVLLKGNFFWQREGNGDEEKALALYQEATRLDPYYAPAWAKIGLVYHSFGYANKIPALEARSKAFMAADRAIQIDPNLAPAHLTLGRIYRDFDWDWTHARSEFEKAVELDPNNNNARADLGYLNWMETGNIDEEISALRQNLIRDPLAMGSLDNLGSSYWVVGRLEESAATFERLLELNPDFVTAQADYARTLLFMGKNAAALAAASKETSELDRLSILPNIYWALGRQSESDQTLEQLKNGHAKVAPYNIASIHAFRGEVDSAFVWLDRAYQQKDPGIANVKFDPYMRELRTDPRFTELLHKMKLTE